MTKLGDLDVKCGLPTRRNFAWLITGIFHSRSVNTGRIALELGWNIKVTSITRRLSRLLANKSVRPREWYRPNAEWLLAEQARIVGEVRLLVCKFQLNSLPPFHLKTLPLNRCV